MSKYEEDRSKRQSDMVQLGKDIRLIRARILYEHIEAHFEKNGTTFGNIFAETLLSCYLEEANALRTPKHRAASA